MKSLITLLVGLMLVGPLFATEDGQHTTLNPEKRTITIDYPNEDIRVMLRDVASCFGYDVSFPEGFHDRVSIKLRNVTLQQIFRQTLWHTDFTFVEEGKNIRIVRGSSVQNGSSPQPSKTSGTSSTVQSNVVSPEQSETDLDPKDLISVDFPNEEIRTVLRNVADLFELNLVVPSTLQGRTTIKLHNVTWRSIFRDVLLPLGYTFEEDGNIVRVVSISRP